MKRNEIVNLGASLGLDILADILPMAFDIIAIDNYIKIRELAAETRSKERQNRNNTISALHEFRLSVVKEINYLNKINKDLNNSLLYLKEKKKEKHNRFVTKSINELVSSIYEKRTDIEIEIFRNDITIEEIDIYRNSLIISSTSSHVEPYFLQELFFSEDCIPRINTINVAKPIRRFDEIYYMLPYNIRAVYAEDETKSFISNLISKRVFIERIDYKKKKAFVSSNKAEIIESAPDTIYCSYVDKINKGGVEIRINGIRCFVPFNFLKSKTFIQGSSIRIKLHKNGVKGGSLIFEQV
jgi:hypothetical protein